MLQQTRVETVIPYYERWMARFPDLPALTQAPLEEVLRQWEGLGYYSRARSLHRTARILLEKAGGVIPCSRSELERLPGIGRYTAAAIASIACGEDEAALDGNIMRVLARLYVVDAPINTPAGKSQLWKLAEDALPPGQAGDFNQALMDLSAMVCLPRSPRCAVCPLSGSCQAHQQGVTGAFPRRQPKPAVPTWTVCAAILREGDTVLLARRPAEGLLGGLWEFPGGKRETGESLEECLKREIREELGIGITVGEEIGIFRHAYTHFRVQLHAFIVEIVRGTPQPLAAPELCWAKIADLETFPMGKIDRLIARQLQG